jgi:hypothetical protein
MDRNPFAPPESTQSLQDPIVARLSSEELPFGDLMSVAYRIVTAYPLTFALIVVLFYGPLHVVSQWPVFHPTGMGTLISLSSMILGFLGSWATVSCAGEALYGRPASLPKALSTMLARFGSLLGAGFVAGLISLLWMLLLVIPGIIAYVRFSFITHAVLIDGSDAGAALKESRDLVEGRWWVVFGILIFTGMFGAISTFVVNKLHMDLAIPFELAVALKTLFSSGTVFGSVMLVAKYVNLRQLADRAFERDVGESASA